MVLRRMVLTESDAPIKIKAKSVSWKLRLSPNIIVAMPKKVTELNSNLPCQRMLARCENNSATSTAPIDCPAESQPYCSTPTCKIWFDTNGRSVLAEEKKVAKKSRIML